MVATSLRGAGWEAPVRAKPKASTRQLSLHFLQVGCWAAGSSDVIIFGFLLL